MAEDKSVVKPLEVPALTPLNVSSKLASTPKSKPRYAVQIKNAQGQPVIAGDPVATRALVALMDVHAVNGGAACHWGGPAAFAEIMSAIHSIMFSTQGREWHEAYNFVNDAGHTENGIYALRANYGFDGLTFDDLKGFRSIASKLTGHGESHLNPEGVLISNGPLGSGLPQAQGLAIGDALAKNDRITICTISDGASMEGEAKEAFAAIPGIAARGKLNPFVVIISDNDTKLSGRITKDSFSMQPTFESLSALGWNVVKVPHGHDLQAVYTAVEKAIADVKADPKKPVALWVKTIKGYGVKSTEESASGGHGFPLANGEKIIEFVNEIYSGKTPQEFADWATALRKAWEAKEEAKKSKPASAAPAVKKDKVQSGFSKGAIDAAKEGYPVYSVSADVQGSTGMSLFQKSCPDRWIEVGIAESNMINAAAGIAKVGFIPIVDTFGQFGITKGNLPLTMAALSQAPVISVFTHIGFQDAADGASHQATTYLAAVSAIPHTTVIIPASSDEAQSFIYQAIKRIAESRKAGKDGENVIFFAGRENFPLHYVENAKYEWGKAQVISEGKDLTIVAAGPMLDKAIKAAAELQKNGVSATVINNPFINKPDTATIGAAVKATGGRLITIEDHQIIAGMGAQLIHALSNEGYALKTASLGIHGEFGQSAYLADELYDKQKLSPAGILAAAEKLLKA